MGDTLTAEKLRRLTEKLPKPEIREVVVDPDASGDTYYRSDDSFVMPHNLWLRFRALIGPPKKASPASLYGVPVRHESGAYHDAVALHRLQGEDRDCTRCYDSGRVVRYYGMGVEKLEPCPACTLEGMSLHPDELFGGPYDGMAVQEARYAAGAPKPLVRRLKEWLGLRHTDTGEGSDE